MDVEKDDFDHTLVTLDAYNKDFHLTLDPSGFSGHPLISEDFAALIWAGVRATYGVMKGKICYEVKVLEYIHCTSLPAEERNPHILRLGFSVENSSTKLGDEPFSYGYEGTGKIKTNNELKDFGDKFMEGDVVMAILNMDSDPRQIGFAKNGHFLGWAFKIQKSDLEDQPLFPHVALKNCSFEVNFGQKELPYFSVPSGFEEYEFLACVPVDQRVRGVKVPERRGDTKASAASKGSYIGEPDAIKMVMKNVVLPLFKMGFAAPFVNHPVENESEIIATAYRQWIQEPMWLQQISDKFEDGKYCRVLEVFSDINLMVHNAVGFNGFPCSITDSAFLMECHILKSIYALKTANKYLELPNYPVFFKNATDGVYVRVDYKNEAEAKKHLQELQELHEVTQLPESSLKFI